MTIQSQKVTWGDVLHIRTIHAGGLSAATDRIHGVMGATIGTRNTFKRLFDFTTAPTPGTKEHERACLLVWAIGGKPEDWGLVPGALPPALQGHSDLLIQHFRCYAGTGSGYAIVGPITGEPLAVAA